MSGVYVLSWSAMRRLSQNVWPQHPSLRDLPARAFESYTGLHFGDHRKPVFHRYTNDLYGCWMMDAFSRVDTSGKIWATRGGQSQNQTLYEFNNKTSYRSIVPRGTIRCLYHLR
ncbi:Uncharacterized protein FKW44_002190 [Caligus rogercresseyi]|uniref:Olfactomedin-like domain-containing protein n=1 Tax=Caligus rogercresseyi TaxID=217165 RepID=A0A7T8KJU0_CALRO|nr:Uncharacterized protein FKW44_002190 [Caligus rogercresseyi]